MVSLATAAPTAEGSTMASMSSIFKLPKTSLHQFLWQTAGVGLFFHGDMDNAVFQVGFALGFKAELTVKAL